MAGVDDYTEEQLHLLASQPHQSLGKDARQALAILKGLRKHQSIGEKYANRVYVNPQEREMMEMLAEKTEQEFDTLGIDKDSDGDYDVGILKFLSPSLHEQHDTTLDDFNQAIHRKYASERRDTMREFFDAREKGNSQKELLSSRQARVMRMGGEVPDWGSNERAKQSFKPQKTGKGRRRRKNPKAKLAMKIAQQLRGRGYGKSDALKIAWQNV